jgi:hypothetical protein
MTGRQQTVTETAGVLRRTISALAMAALVAVILVVMVAPALAGQSEGQYGIDLGSSQNHHHNGNFPDLD